MDPRSSRRLAYAVSCGLLAACVAVDATRDRQWIDSTLSERVGAGLRTEPGRGELVVPEGVDVGDGIDMDEAVALAFFNNPELEAALSELDVSRAEVVQAGLLRNPALSLLLPLGPKQLEAALSIPADALWARPRRVRVATLDLEAVAEDLVGDGLRLARDTRVAFARAAEAGRRLDLARRVEVMRRRRLELARRRVLGGDEPARVLDEHRLDLSRAADHVARMEGESKTALVRLADRMGWGPVATMPAIVAGPDGPPPLPVPEGLVTLAVASRPEVRAAELRVRQAVARADLADAELMAVSLVIDANEEGTEGFEAGPGIALEIPVFDQGQGRDAIARADLARGLARLRAASRRVATEVRLAWQAAHAARLRREAHERGALAAARSVVGARRRAREAGELSEIDVVESELDLLIERELAVRMGTDAWMAMVELEAAVGRRLTESEGME